MKQDVESPSKKRTKQLLSGPGKRRKTLQMVESYEFDESEDEEDGPIE